MLEDFINKKFNGNREEAIKCIAYELSTMEYTNTLDMDTCRRYASNLTAEEKQIAYDYFKQNLKANQQLEKRLSSLKLSYEEVQSGQLDASAFNKTVTVDMLAILLINLRALSLGIEPWKDIVSILVTPVMLALILRAVVKYYKSKKVMEYVGNESELLDSLGLTQEQLNEYAKDQNTNDMEEKGKVL